MFRRFEVTTGNNPDRSDAFNGFAFLRDLLCRCITGSLCAMVNPVSEGAQTLGAPEALIAFPGWFWCRFSARSQMRQTERLTTLVSKLSTVRMIDELSLQLSAYARCRPILGQEQPARRARRDAATVLVLVAFGDLGLPHWHHPCCFGGKARTFGSACVKAKQE